jgi:hypothetical protein
MQPQDLQLPQEHRPVLRAILAHFVHLLDVLLAQTAQPALLHRVVQLLAHLVVLALLLMLLVQIAFLVLLESIVQMEVVYQDVLHAQLGSSTLILDKLPAQIAVQVFTLPQAQPLAWCVSLELTVFKRDLVGHVLDARWGRSIN